MRIEIRAKHQTGPNGDRYRGPGVPYFSYKVVLVHEGGQENVIQAWSGFDDMWTCPKPKAQIAREVADYANAQAKFFKCKVSVVEVSA